MEGARRVGAQTECAMLGEMRIEECDGCHACWKGKGCPRRDDMNGLYERIAGADAMVFGTPVYWYGPTALMKGFVDRFVYFNCEANRPAVAGKRAAIVVPMEETDEAGAELVVEFFGRCFGYLEMEFSGRLIVPGLTGRGQVRTMPEAMEEARRMGEMLGG